MIYCIIGEDRSGVEALASACEGIPELHNRGDIFNVSPRSEIHEHFSSRSFKAADLRDGAQAFHLYREFFQSVIDSWKRSNYTTNGFLFTIKYETLLGSPGLFHYLETAEVQFLHVVRNDFNVLLASILERRDGDRSADAIRNLAGQVMARRAYFDKLEQSRSWPRVVNEELFDTAVIQHPDTLSVIANFFRLDTIGPIIPSTRPSFSESKRAELLASIHEASPFG